MTKTNLDTAPIHSVYLNLHGDDLSPAKVTEILGIDPTKSWRMGDKHITSIGNEVIRKSGLGGLMRIGG